VHVGVRRQFPRGVGTFGYFTRIRRSHSALTMGLRNVLYETPLILGFARAAERDTGRGPE